ncbi:hypothetical protein B0H15DRAFT_850126 [Mycena belliarum]|uniref:Uncharacterized protein n=1 Tax=Mycena belliarum TaxID=1033014 RepID=A0AAD6U1F7_9AGAR|nr:hypothetical protein B0H15DRAFT_850126 [Mycena belliae]
MSASSARLLVCELAQCTSSAFAGSLSLSRSRGDVGSAVRLGNMSKSGSMRVSSGRRFVEPKSGQCSLCVHLAPGSCDSYCLHLWRRAGRGGGCKGRRCGPQRGRWAREGQFE